MARSYLVYILFGITFINCKSNYTYQITPNIIVLGEEKPKNNLSLTEKSNNLAPPTNMCFVPSGTMYIGGDKNGLQQEKPRFWVFVKAFFMDISPVSVAEFRAFVQATNYVTEAENFGNAGFIDKSSDFKWILKQGAYWEYPQGKDFPKATDDLPVTQISWNDAQAYAKWIGKRLPHELEWEYAARNARNDQTLYSFGDSLQNKNGSWRANIWQGSFPFQNNVEDGYRFASPNGFFGKTPLGLTDMTGNVWQWCINDKFNYSDVLLAMKNNQPFLSNPAERAQRGGSYLCEEHWCHGYRVSGRSFASPETALMHVGFRCVKDVE